MFRHGLTKTAMSLPPFAPVGLAAALGALVGKLGRNVPTLVALEKKSPAVFDALMAAAVTAIVIGHGPDKKDHKLPATPDNPTFGAGFIPAPGFLV